MLLFKKQSSIDVTEYTPIAKAQYNLDADAELKVKRKCDIAYLIAKHNLHGIHKDLRSLCVSWKRSMGWTWARGKRMTKYVPPS